MAPFRIWTTYQLMGPNISGRRLISTASHRISQHCAAGAGDHQPFCARPIRIDGRGRLAMQGVRLPAAELCINISILLLYQCSCALLLRP